MKNWIWLGLAGFMLGLPPMGLAQVYKLVDSKGRVTFTDTYHPGATRIKLAGENTVSQNRKLSPTFKHVVKDTRHLLKTRARFLSEIAIVKKGLAESRKAYERARQSGSPTEALLSEINLQQVYLDSLREKMHNELNLSRSQPEAPTKRLVGPHRENQHEKI